MAILDCKSSFGFKPGVTYLDHGGFGVAPREVLEVADNIRRDIEAAPRPFFDVDFRPRWRDVAALVARRFAAAPGDVALVVNVTEGVNAVLRGFSLRETDEILITSMTYGAVARAARRVAAEKCANVVEARIPFPSPSPEQSIEAIRAAITPRTKLAILDHITSPTALVLPIKDMIQVCHDMGVMTLVDGAHTPGNIALNIGDVGADWYTGSLHKWHFAPRACGFLWTNPRLPRYLAPTIISWDADELFPASFEWTGTRDPSAWLSVPAAFDFMDKFGAEEVMRHNYRLVSEGSRLIARMWGVEIAAPERMTSGMALVPLPIDVCASSTEQDRQKVQMELWNSHAVACSCIRFDDALYVRVCANIYNNIDDFVRLGKVVGEWRR